MLGLASERPFSLGDGKLELMTISSLTVPRLLPKESLRNKDWLCTNNGGERGDKIMNAIETNNIVVGNLDTDDDNDDFFILTLV
mmetsp:Transcript_29933/g.62999  ORF Transcript_29933/g.62999 Transcript_29933/m.62999 type:complete len:84 (-) Transcript_29933:419-670(-)